MAEATVQNPYVGPRTFTYEQRALFFGRERETRDLLARVLSERLLLFYAQSGAGKSSLINTRLIPQLREKGFVTLPVARINGELPPGVAGVDNIYAFNLMLSIDEGDDPTRLASVSLTDFLARLVFKDRMRWVYDPTIVPQPTPSHVTRRYALIIDQFEELITTHPDHWREREDFFRQLDRAMQDDPNLWVVLTLREDYVAALDPYAPLMTERLRARFYMERMSREAALEAIREPAKLGGRLFAAGVAETLVDNLSQVRVLGPQGQVTTAVGQYVEPVQLQVVCYQLWEGLPPLAPGQSGQITADDVHSAGDVDTALTDFYTAALQRVVETPGLGVNEPELRRWFSTKLITPAGTRGIIFRGESETEGMPNAVVDSLEGQFLLRREPRGGGEWVELVHDRFVDPILRANRAAQTPLARDAEAWETSHRDGKWLYQGQKLRDAQTDLDTEPAKHSDTEREFVKAGERRQRQLLAGFGGVVALLLLFAGLAGWGWRNAREAQANAAEADRQAAAAATSEADAIMQKATAEASAAEARRQQEAAQMNAAEAQRQKQVAFSRQLAAQSTGHLDDQLDLTLLLAKEAYMTAHTGEARRILYDSLEFSPALRTFLRAASRPIFSIAFSSQGRLTPHIAFSPDRDILASASCAEANPNECTKGEITLWDTSNAQQPSQLGQIVREDLSDVRDIAFKPDGKTLTSRSSRGIVTWDLSNPRQLRQLTQPLTIPSDAVEGVVSPDGRTAAVVSPCAESTRAGCRKWEITLWDVSNQEQRHALDQRLTVESSDVNALSFSFDSKTLAVAACAEFAFPECTKGKIILWDVSNPGQPRLLGDPVTGHSSNIRSLAFSHDDSTLASAGDDKTIILWDVSQTQGLSKSGQLLKGHLSGIHSIVFSHDDTTLASAGDDQAILLWDVTNVKQSRALSWPVDRQLYDVDDLAFSKDGKFLATAEDKDIRLWRVSNPRQPISVGAPLHHFESVRSVAFSPDSKTLASGSDDGSITLWDISTPEQSRMLGQLLHGQVISVAFSPDGQTLASGSGDRTIILWDVSNREQPRPLGQPLKRHRGVVSSVAFSPDGKTLASGSWDNTIILWDVSNPEQPRPLDPALQGHSSFVNSVAFSPDGKTLASGGNDRTIILWDVSNPKQPRPLGPALPSSSSSVYRVAFSPDGKTLASGSDDNSIHLWDVSTPEQPLRLDALPYRSSRISGLTFRPDSNTLAASGRGPVATLWDVDPESWMARACSIANRNLSRAEWDQYIGPETTYHKTCPDLPLGEGVAGP